MTAARIALRREAGAAAEAQKAPDAFEEIDFGSYFEDFMDPPVHSHAEYDPDKPGFEAFLSSPVTLTDHLRQQLSLIVVPSEIRDATEAILGNLDEAGYLEDTLENIAAIDFSNSPISAGVWFSRYFRTKAVTPSWFSQRTCGPPFSPMDRRT